MDERIYNCYYVLYELTLKLKHHATFAHVVGQLFNSGLLSAISIAVLPIMQRNGCYQVLDVFILTFVLHIINCQ